MCIQASAMGIREGDRVAYNSFFSYAEYTAVPAAKLLPVPQSIGLDVATALVVQVDNLTNTKSVILASNVRFRE